MNEFPVAHVREPADSAGRVAGLAGHVRDPRGPTSIQIAANVCGGTCRRNTDDLVLGRMLRVVDDEDVDTILRRLDLEPELFL